MRTIVIYRDSTVDTTTNTEAGIHPEARVGESYSATWRDVVKLTGSTDRSTGNDFSSWEGG